MAHQKKRRAKKKRKARAKAKFHKDPDLVFTAADIPVLVL